MGRPDDVAFRFDNATVVRGDGAPVLRDLTWTVRAGEAWAVVGATASGKTTLLEAIRGSHRLSAGSRTPPPGVVRMVAFKEESRTFSYAGQYYQQRYEFADTDEPLSLSQFLLARTQAEATAVREVAEQLGIVGQLDQPFVTLSNGQTRRARIAKALLAAPALLLLDDPFVGIDAAGRSDLTARLGELVALGRGVVIATSPAEVPDWVTHVLELNEGRLAFAGPRSLQPEGLSPPDQGFALGSRLEEIALQAEDDSYVIELRNVTVRHGGKAILDGVNWTVRRGERWAILGPNGAGKTTLLALACGDHPQAFSNDVKLFGRRRGSGETIWDVKRNIGFVSPEFHLYFREALTAYEVAATAFGDSLLYRAPTAEQAEEIRTVFAAFGCEELRDRKFARLSVGQQRLALLVRAVVKRPPLLILDEPFQGLDVQTADRIRDWLDATLRADQTLVFVTHIPAHLPRSVARRLLLDRGRVVG